MPILGHILFPRMDRNGKKTKLGFSNDIWPLGLVMSGHMKKKGKFPETLP